MPRRCKLCCVSFITNLPCGRLLSRVQPHTIFHTVPNVLVVAVLSMRCPNEDPQCLSPSTLQCHSNKLVSSSTTSNTFLIIPTDHFQVQNASHLYHSSPASRQRLDVSNEVRAKLSPHTT
jgi:hypothetical protein